MEKATVEKVLERVDMARTSLTIFCPFFGHLVLKVTPVVTERVPLAGVTRDRKLLINPDWAMSTTDAELAATIVHEVLHLAFKCWSRQGSRNAIAVGPDGVPVSLWNIAQDYCFPAGTILGGAWQPIEAIGPGADVIGQHGVTQTVAPMSREYSGLMVTVQGLGVEVFDCTWEHPILVWRKRRTSYPIRLKDEPEWLPAGTLRADDYLVIPRLKGSVSVESVDLHEFIGSGRWGEDDVAHNVRCRSFPLNTSTAYLLGAFAAEGDTGGEQVRFTLNEKETAFAQRLQDVLASLGYSSTITPIAERHGLRVVCGSSVLSRFFRQVCGAGAAQKRMPDFILHHADLELVHAFLRGYHEGDGHLGGAGDYQGAGTASHILALQLQLAWARLGRLAKLYYRPQKDRCIGDHFTPGGSPFWLIEAHEGVGTDRELNGATVLSTSHRWRVMQDYILTPVKSVTTRHFVGPVYNVETADHTYTVSNVVVHNCINEVIEHMGQTNKKLTRDRFLPPTEWQPKGLYDSKYDGWSDEEVYDDLLKNLKPPPPSGRGQGQPSSGSGSGSGSGGPLYHPDVNGGQADMQEGSGDGSGEGEGEGGGMSPSAQKAEDMYWDMAMVEAAQVHEQSKTKGSLPARIKKMIQDITEPKVNWFEALSRWVGENGRRGDFSYMRPSRRAEAAGAILPSMKKWGVADIAIIWDTSGSMNGRETEIMNEVVGMCQEIGMSVWVITCDTEVHATAKGVDSVEEIAQTLVGGGGSDFRPAFKLIEEEQFEGAVVAFTDGYISVPEMKPINVQGVLWVLWQHDIDPTGGRWGEVLRVDDDGNVKR